MRIEQRHWSPQVSGPARAAGLGDSDLVLAFGHPSAIGDRERFAEIRWAYPRARVSPTDLGEALPVADRRRVSEGEDEVRVAEPGGPRRPGHLRRPMSLLDAHGWPPRRSILILPYASTLCTG